MQSLFLHPGFVLIITGILVALVPDKLRKPLMIIGPAAAIIVTVMMDAGGGFSYEIFPGYALDLMHADRTAFIFSLIFSVEALIAAVYSLNTHTKGEMITENIYAGSSISVVLAGDWLSMVIFWEIMAVSGWFTVTASKTKESTEAGFRYILVHVLGGNFFLVGALLKIMGGSYEVANITGTQDLAFWLLLLGVAVNAAIPPVNSWVSDAYPESTLGGTVYLASFTTKVGMYAVIRLFAGTHVLLYFGVFMALYGACMALIENDIRRLLSYHIVSQLGYIVAAAALGSPVGMDGACLHTVNNIIYKGVLIMAAGAVIYATGKRRISDVGGLAKKMPVTFICFLIASLSIAGFPLFNGFISKGYIMHAVSEGGAHIAELLLMAASVASFLSITLKMNYFIFIRENKAAGDMPLKKVPTCMSIAMISGTALCIIMGVVPSISYALAPNMTQVNAYTLSHILEYVEIFAGAILGFYVFRRIMAPHVALTLDFDWIYRKPLKLLINLISVGLEKLFNGFRNVFSRAIATIYKCLKDPTEIARIAGAAFYGRKNAIETDDVLKRPAGMLVAIDILLGAAVFAAVVILCT